MTGIELLRAWIKKTGISKNNLDQDGRACNFLFDQTLPVSVESPAYSDDIFIVIEISEAGEGDIRRRRLETAMQLNAYSLETRGATLGWDTAGKRIILSYRAASAHTTAAILDNMISNLVDVSYKIKPRLLMKKETAAKLALECNFDNMFQPVVS